METMIRIVQGRGMVRLNESLMSLTHGLMMTGNEYNCFHLYRVNNIYLGKYSYNTFHVHYLFVTLFEIFSNWNCCKRNSLERLHSYTSTLRSVCSSMELYLYVGIRSVSA